MNLPFTIDMNKQGAKEYVQSAIDRYGESWDVNQIGKIVRCLDSMGNKFSIIQMHSNKRLVTFSSNW